MFKQLHHLRALTQPVRSGDFDGGLQNGLRLDLGRLDVWAAVDAGNVPLIPAEIPWLLRCSFRLCAASMDESERRPVEQRPIRALPFSFVKEAPTATCLVCLLPWPTCALPRAFSTCWLAVRSIL